MLSGPSRNRTMNLYSREYLPAFLGFAGLILGLGITALLAATFWPNS